LKDAAATVLGSVFGVLTIPSDVDNLVRKLIGLKKIQWPSG